MTSWIPDWTDESEYPEKPKETKLECLSGRERKFWAWQFLRRNQGYQNSFIKNECHIKEMNKAHDVGKIYRMNHDLYDMYQKYKFSGQPTSPEDQYPNDRMTFTSTSLPTQHKEPGLDDHCAPWVIESEMEVLIKFDLSLSIDSQIKNAKKHLTGRKEYLTKRHGFNLSRRFHVRLFNDYLRIHDADSNNVDLHQIASVILPEISDDYESDYLGSKRIRKMLKEAQRLVNTDYVFIVSG